jgi:DNA modification methylase
MYIVVFSKGTTRFESSFEYFYQNQIWHLKTTPSFLGSKRLYQWAYNLRHSGRWYGRPAQRLYKLLRPLAVRNKYEATDYLTQCPEEVVEMVLDRFSDRGDTVCDPFLGSGTTLKVAHKMRRNCIGFEINPAVKATILRKAATPDVLVFE